MEIGTGITISTAIIGSIIAFSKWIDSRKTPIGTPPVFPFQDHKMIDREITNLKKEIEGIKKEIKTDIRELREAIKDRFDEVIDVLSR